MRIGFAIVAAWFSFLLGFLVCGSIRMKGFEHMVHVNTMAAYEQGLSDCKTR